MRSLYFLKNHLINLYDIGTHTLVCQQLADGSWSPETDKLSAEAYGCTMEDKTSFS